MSNRKDLHDSLEIETIRKRLKKLAGECRSLDNFTCQALQLVGEYIDASSLTVSIQDCEQDCGVIYARLSKQNNSWQFDLGDAGTFNKGPAVKHSQADAFSHHPLHILCLDLPPKWQGVFQVEYPVTVRISSPSPHVLKNILTDLSYGLHIALLNQRLINLEDSLQKEMQIKRNLKILSRKQSSKIRTLNHQVKAGFHDIAENEKQKKPVLEYVPRPMSSSAEKQSFFTKQILKDVEQSRNMTLLGELASGVAHQIRNPLNSLLGALHLIKDDETPEEERRKLFDQLTERVETINRTISELIYYTRITELNRTSEDINTVLQNTLHSFKSLIDQSNVELITSFALKLPTINLDLYLMNQVFHNIIKNALEAMNNVGQLRISVKRLKTKHGPKPSLEFVQISFQDTGPGIPKDDLKKVLNPFYSKKYDCIGLGLSIVKHVVQVHGGATQVKSQLGLFTNVTIYLPIR